MINLFCLLLCFVGLIGLFVAFVVWLVRREQRIAQQPQQATVVLREMQHVVERWVGEGELSQAEAEPVLRLLARKLAPAVVSTAAPEAFPPLEDALVPAAAVAEPAAPVVTPTVNVPLAAATPQAPAPTVQRSEPIDLTLSVPAVARPSRTDQLWTALLAMRTRQTLLFLGAFLLLISSLVLVVFNWDSIPHVLQSALLVGVCGGLWFGGDQLGRRWGVPQVAHSLQAVSGVLVPVTAFSLIRLVSLDAQGSWLAVSLLSLPFYVAASWRNRQLLFAVAGCLAGASLVGAGVSFVAWSALPAVLALLMLAYLPFSRWLQARAPELALAPRWSAQAGVPAALLATGALAFSNALGLGAVGAVLWVAVAFYVVAARLERNPAWTWFASAVGPLALGVSCAWLLPGQPLWWNVALVLLLVVYSAVADQLRRKNAPRHADAPFLLAHLLTPSALIVALLSWGSTEGALALWLGFGFYLLALWFERLAHWSWATALVLPMALAATLLSNGIVPARTFALLLIGLALGYVLLADRLKRGPFAVLAKGPFGVAHVGVPLVLCWSAILHGRPPGFDVLTLWCGVGFYLLTLVLERKALWMWPSLGLTLIALVSSLSWIGVSVPWVIVGVAALGLGYVVLATVLDPRARPFALPAYGLGMGVVVAATTLAFLYGSFALQLTLPVAVVSSLVLLVGSHRGRFSWLPAAERDIGSVGVLAVAWLLFSAWAWAMLDLAQLAYAWRGLALLPLAGSAFVTAWGTLGRLRPLYSPSLQAIGTLLTVVFGLITLLDLDASVFGMMVVTAIWLFQTILYRRSTWASMTMGTSLMAVFLILLRFDAPEAVWLATGVALTFAYTLGAAQARTSSWRCISVPGVAFGTVVGLFTLTLVAGTVESRPASAAEILTVFALAGCAAANSVVWRQSALGYVAAPLLAFSGLLLAQRGFFAPIALQQQDYGYVVCGITTLCVAIGQGLRVRSASYARPYEQVGYAMLVFAPLLAGVAPQQATICWAVTSLLCVFAAWRYQMPPVVVPAMLAADAALVFGAGWLLPGGLPRSAGILLLGAVWAQALWSYWARRSLPQFGFYGYIGAGLTGIVALMFAGADMTLNPAVMQVAFGLAVLLALLASLERREEVAWGSLAMLAFALLNLHHIMQHELLWGLAYGVGEALILSIVGWQVAVLAAQGAHAALQIWHRPLIDGSFAAGCSLVLVIALFAPLTMALLPLTFALVMLSLLLVTQSVSRRSIPFAYGAGGTLVAAALCQLAVWRIGEPQWYVLPSGIYLLALADGLRRFQGKRQISQVIECGALLLMLGTTAVEAFRSEGLLALGQTTLLCGEALLLLAYGMLARIRVPFLGGLVFFVLGVLWLGIDPLLASNKWLLLGLLGLTLVGLYVLLERRQEQLVRAGRIWIERVSAWQ